MKGFKCAPEDVEDQEHRRVEMWQGLNKLRKKA